jgi:hypothetical protein
MQSLYSTYIILVSRIRGTLLKALFIDRHDLAQYREAAAARTSLQDQDTYRHTHTHRVAYAHLQSKASVELHAAIHARYVEFMSLLWM